MNTQTSLAATISSLFPNQEVEKGFNQSTLFNTPLRFDRLSFEDRLEITLKVCLQWSELKNIYADEELTVVASTHSLPIIERTRLINGVTMFKSSKMRYNRFTKFSLVIKRPKNPALKANYVLDSFEV